MPEKTLISEQRAIRIKRLIYQSGYTGGRETDAILGSFARTVLPGLDDAGLDSYEALLALGDRAIWGIVSGMMEAPPGLDRRALDALLAHVRRQPVTTASRG